MTFLRRFLVVAALMFWQGGFTFYAGIVVPIGQRVLDSPQDQGFITREVTRYLNLSGLIALAILGWDVATGGDGHSWRRWTRGLTWTGMLLCLAALAWLHPQLDQLLDPQTGRIRERALFRTGHRWYLWISTVQWSLAVVYTLTTVASWQATDVGGERQFRGREEEQTRAQKKGPAVDFSGVAQSPKSSFSGTPE
jgi:hypothetical protein